MVTFNKEYFLTSNLKMYSSQVLEILILIYYTQYIILNILYSNKNLFSFEIYYKILSKKSQIRLI